ncbi:MAG: GHKL domain-containing protein [Candidatus Thiodiazotropha sp. (ex Myrtea spinifera)]|nr:GHKL domain-containing protein [Candidatus Thiodiazotropha sp. (ex Myrtea spinifera)]
MDRREPNLSKKWLVTLVVAGLYGIVLWQVSQLVRERTLDEVNTAGQRQLNIYVTHLKGQLEKYEFLPELLSTNARLVELLRRPGDRQRIDALNRYLEIINTIANASDTYLMDREGLTIAASNWQSEKPFIGRNFSYRPYFQQAMLGHLGRYYALGTTSGKRGYYFAYPVRQMDEILGAVVIKVDLTTLEQQWRGRQEEVVVTDPEGVIFITTRPDWRFRSLYPLSESDQERIDKSRRYSGASVEPLNIRQRTALSGDSRLMTLGPMRGMDHLSGDEEYLVQQVQMPEAGWRVHLMTPLQQVQRRVGWSLMITTFAFAVLVLLGLFLQQRQRRRRERVRYEAQANLSLREARDRLEQRVEERTVDLRQEMAERRRMELALRQTRDELIQAAKLAMLGQMSASISHEINQPLAAIRSYTDNAKQFLQQDRCDDVAWNLDQIGELIDSMTQISSQLKLFARKTDGQRSPVSLHNVIEASKRILLPRLSRTGTEVRVQSLRDDIEVMADPVRLEQVLVNLIGNAVNAMEKQTERWVSIGIEYKNEQLCLTIHDNGPGISEEHLKRIFDPFFTTRETGLGLGLSISQHIIESMGGTLMARNSEQGGALFSLQLPLADRV